MLHKIVRPSAARTGESVVSSISENRDFYATQMIRD